MRREVEERETTSEHPDKGNARKRKRTPEWTSSPDAMLGNVAGPSRKPPLSDPAALKSPSRSKKATTERQGVINLTSFDVEDEPIASSSKGSLDGLYFMHVLIISVDDEFVSCPLCQRKVQFKIINAHMDKNCQDVPSSDNAAMSWSKIMGAGKNGQQKGKNKCVTKLLN